MTHDDDMALARFLRANRTSTQAEIDKRTLAHDAQSYSAQERKAYDDGSARGHYAR